MGRAGKVREGGRFIPEEGGTERGWLGAGWLDTGGSERGVIDGGGTERGVTGGGGAVSGTGLGGVEGVCGPLLEGGSRPDETGAG